MSQVEVLLWSQALKLLLTNWKNILKFQSKLNLTTVRIDWCYWQMLRIIQFRVQSFSFKKLKPVLSTQLLLEFQMLLDLKFVKNCQKLKVITTFVQLMWETWRNIFLKISVLLFSQTHMTYKFPSKTQTQSILKFLEPMIQPKYQFIMQTNLKIWLWQKAKLLSLQNFKLIKKRMLKLMVV